MELSWMGFNMKPPTKEKEYWVTVRNQYWDKPKAMMLNWSEGVWQLNGNKIPSTWVVKWWLELPPANED